jgi:hypothetical protein
VATHIKFPSVSPTTHNVFPRKKPNPVRKELAPRQPRVPNLTSSQATIHPRFPPPTTAQTTPHRRNDNPRTTRPPLSQHHNLDLTVRTPIRPSPKLKVSHSDLFYLYLYIRGASTSTYVQRVLAEQAAVESRLLELDGMETINTGLKNTKIRGENDMAVDPPPEPPTSRTLEAKKKALARFVSRSIASHVSVKRVQTQSRDKVLHWVQILVMPRVVSACKKPWSSNGRHL